MSWIRDFMYSFVFPAFVAAGKETTEIGEPFDVQASRHAPERLPGELRKMWTLCELHDIEWSWDVREHSIYQSGSQSSSKSKYRDGARVNHRIWGSTLDSAVAAMRAEGCDRLLLGGRDVWVLSVLCERRKIPYLYVPELSRTVCDSPGVKEFLASRGFTGRELFLDTGFAGSIPRSLARWYGGVPFKFRLMSQGAVVSPGPGIANLKGIENFELVDGDPGAGEPGKFLRRKGANSKKVSKYLAHPNQLFPNRSDARKEALEAEYLAKFWERGTYDADMPVGYAPAVQAEWRDKPGVKKISDPRNLRLGLTDGKEFVQVGITDMKLAPGLYDWMKSLPEAPVDERPKSRIYQRFASKQSIQRAAMLTSMVWRGIPYWKIKEVKASKPAAVAYGGAVQWPTSVTVLPSSSSTAALTYTTNLTTNSAVTTGSMFPAGTIVQTFVPNADLANPMLAPKNIPILKQIAKAQQAGQIPALPQTVEMPISQAHQLEMAFPAAAALPGAAT